MPLPGSLFVNDTANHGTDSVAAHRRCHTIWGRAAFEHRDHRQRQRSEHKQLTLDLSEQGGYPSYTPYTPFLYASPRRHDPTSRGASLSNVPSTSIAAA